LQRQFSTDHRLKEYRRVSSSCRRPDHAADSCRAEHIPGAGFSRWLRPLPAGAGQSLLRPRRCPAWPFKPASAPSPSSTPWSFWLWSGWSPPPTCFP